MNDLNLATLGFTAHEIKAMYLVQEPWLQELLDAAAELDEEDRQAMLVLMQTLSIVRLRRSSRSLAKLDESAQTGLAEQHNGS